MREVDRSALELSRRKGLGAYPSCGEAKRWGLCDPLILFFQRVPTGAQDQGPCMHLVFIDDTKQTGRRANLGSLISLGGVAFEAEQVKPFAEAFWAIYDANSIPHDAELKWSPDGKTSWWVRPENKHLLTPVREAVLQAAIDHEGIAFVVSWDMNESGFQSQTPERLVLRFLFERVAMMLQNKSDLGVLIFDEPGGGPKDQDAWLGNSRALTDSGTEYVKADGIVTPILTAASHHHPHLQAADLIVGSTTGAFVGNSYGQALMPLVKPMLHTNWRGEIGGAGVKLYPDSTVNLLHWTLQETSYSRNGGSLSLPWKSWRFAVDDGITGEGLGG